MSNFSKHSWLNNVLAWFQASAVPRPENSNSDEKDALFGLDTQITREKIARAKLEGALT
jgi:hypothetical protein